MSRLIDADALIDELNNTPIDCDDELTGRGWCCSTIETVINEQETIEPNKWIPCEERLPENEDDVLMYVENMEECMVGFYDGERWNETEYSDDRANWVYAVTAWMPLPSPYEG